MKSIIKIMSVALLAMMSFAGPAVAGEKVALVLSTLNNPFFVTLKDGAQAKADELGIELMILDSQNDSARELANVEDALNRGVALLMINPTDSDAVGSAIKAANRKNIAVVTIDRGATSGAVVSHVASDNVLGGQMAGELIKSKLGKNAKLVELEGVPGTSAARDRGKGFNEAVSGMDVVARQAADFDRTKGLSVMENILQAQKTIDAVFAHNDEMALGAIKAIEASGRKITVVGFDGTDDGVAAVKSGSMLATIAQQADVIGSLGVETAAKVLKGESVEEYTPVSLKLIQK